MAAQLRLEIANVLTTLLASPLPPGHPALAEKWKIFYRLQNRRLSRVGRKVGLRPDRILEVMHNVCVEMLHHWKEYQPDRALALLKLTRKRMRSRSVDKMRRDDRRRAEPLESLGEEPQARSASERAFRVQCEEWRAWLDARLKELPEKDRANRALLRMHYLGNRSLASLVALTGLPISAIKCRLTRLLRKLRRLAREHPPGGEPLP